MNICLFANRAPCAWLNDCAQKTNAVVVDFIIVLYIAVLALVIFIQWFIRLLVFPKFMLDNLPQYAKRRANLQ